MKNIKIGLVFILFFLVTLICVFLFFNSKGITEFKLSFDHYKIPYTTFVVDDYPVYVMIDTGSSLGFHLNKAQLKKIKKLQEDTIYRNVDAAGKTQESVQYRAEPISIRGIKLTSTTVCELKPWGMTLSGENEQIPDGPVAGIGVFKDNQILLDYASNTLTVFNDANYSSLIKENFTEFSFHLSPNGMVFDVEQSGKIYHFILDTGATVSVVWGERLAPHERVSCLLVDPSISDKECKATQFTLTPQKGTPVHFNAVVVPGDFKHMEEVDGLIGNNLLRERKMLIDFKKNKAFISNV